jgi:uncharacterized OsmC-like protein
LQGALEARHVPSAGLEATVEGRVERVSGRVRVTAVRARYRLPVAPELRAAAERALHVHERACPASNSVRGAIAVSWEADLSDTMS